MDEAAKDTNQEESSSAASSKPIKRRRRLAHRRQYARSRRGVSSYLRSQFVRYDDGDPLVDSWTRTRTLEGDQLTSDWVQFEASEKARQVPSWRSELLHQHHDNSAKPSEQKQLAPDWSIAASGPSVPDSYLSYYSSSSLDSYTLEAASSVPSNTRLESPPYQRQQLLVRSHERIDLVSRPGSPYLSSELGSRRLLQNRSESFVSSSVGDVSEALLRLSLVQSFLSL